MRKIFFTLNFCAIMLVCSVSRVDAQTTLIPEIPDTYLAKLVETARQHYPTVKTYASRIKIAEGNVAKAKISYFDEITLSYVYTPHAGQGTTGVVATNPVTTTTTGTSVASNYNYFNNIQVGFFFNPANFFVKPYNVRAANEDLKVARNDQAQYLITLASSVKKAYYAYLQRQVELKVQIQNAAFDEQTVSIVKHRFERGEETFETYNRAVSGAAANTVARIGAEFAYLSAKSDLEDLLGVKIETVK